MQHWDAAEFEGLFDEHDVATDVLEAFETDVLPVAAETPTTAWHWSAEEDHRLMQAKARGLPWRRVFPLFPERAPASVQQRYYAFKKGLGLTVPVKWTREDDDRLLRARNQGESWARVVSLFPSRTECAVRQRAHLLSVDGLIAKRKPARSRPWSPEDEARLLAAKARGVSGKRVALMFPNRTYAAVTARYAMLKAKPKMSSCGGSM